MKLRFVLYHHTIELLIRSHLLLCYGIFANRSSAANQHSINRIYKAFFSCQFSYMLFRLRYVSTLFVYVFYCKPRDSTIVPKFFCSSCWSRSTTNYTYIRYFLFGNIISKHLDKLRLVHSYPMNLWWDILTLDWLTIAY